MILHDQKAEGEGGAPSAPPPAYPSPPSGSSGYPQQDPQRGPPNNWYPPHTGPWNPPMTQPGYDAHSQWVGDQYRNQLLARCARGDHDVTTSFGLCGIICAILLFPIGLICLCIDTEKKCTRCGTRLG